MTTLTWEDFCDHAMAVARVPLSARNVGREGGLNDGQVGIVSATVDRSLFVIAGPGSGKTTASALRILKLIYVDGLDPLEIVATTFTRRAAAVLRSRIIEWGENIRARVLRSRRPAPLRFERLDFNQLRVGTIDSIAQDLLNEFRAAGAPRPTPVDTHVFAALMMAEGVRPTAAARSRRLCAFLESLGFNTYGGLLGFGGRAAALVEIRERLINDRVDRAALLAGAGRGADDVSVGLSRALEAIETFEAVMREREIFDFAGLNEYFLEALGSGRMNDFLATVRFVLVDEYQDTNYLQESIYFALAAAARDNGGSICVVGDDDQSLYRFRGATVELFAGFRGRARDRVRIEATEIALNLNYRSTRNIVSLVDSFVRSDVIFQQARVIGKPALLHGAANEGELPLVGMFEDGEQLLAQEVAGLIGRLVNGGRIRIADAEGQRHAIALDAERGSAGDIAILFDSTSEYRASGTERFPRLLRDELEALDPPIGVFNPRGQPLKKQAAVRRLLGLALLCLDPNGSILGSQRIGDPVLRELRGWRDDADAFLVSGPANLRRFVDSWQRRRATRPLRGNTNVSLSDLLYKLVTWIPAFQDDVEHLAWLEAIMRAVSAASLLRGFRGELIFAPGSLTDELATRSVADAIWRVFAPIADDVIEVEEDLLETLPRNRVNFMTIHQAKGLEFPVTIVDVGSELGDGRVSKPFKRYPTDPDRVHRMEDFFRPYSQIDLGNRTGQDRAFDDLTRKYFVAFSRAQDLLILVGHSVATTGISRSKRTMQSVATGWRRPSCAPAELWPWRGLSFLRRL